MFCSALLTHRKLEMQREDGSEDVNEAHPLRGLKVLDVGCGGGLLCEVRTRQCVMSATSSLQTVSYKTRWRHTWHRRVRSQHWHRVLACCCRPGSLVAAMWQGDAHISAYIRGRIASSTRPQIIRRCMFHGSHRARRQPTRLPIQLCGIGEGTHYHVHSMKSHHRPSCSLVVISSCLRSHAHHCPTSSPSLRRNKPFDWSLQALTHGQNILTQRR